MQLHTNNQLSVESLTTITQYYLISLNMDTSIKNASKKDKKKQPNKKYNNKAESFPTQKGKSLKKGRKQEKNRKESRSIQPIDREQTKISANRELATATYELSGNLCELLPREHVEYKICLLKSA
jgi:hypothetical protein